MSDEGSPQDKLAGQLLGGPIVSEATQAISKLFKSTFDALTGDIQKLIQSSKTSDPRSAAINTLTLDMITLLSKQVSAAVSNPLQGAGPAGASQPGEQPGGDQAGAGASEDKTP